MNLLLDKGGSEEQTETVVVSEENFQQYLESFKEAKEKKRLEKKKWPKIMSSVKTASRGNFEWTQVEDDMIALGYRKYGNSPYNKWNNIRNHQSTLGDLTGRTAKAIRTRFKTLRSFFQSHYNLTGKYLYNETLVQGPLQGPLPVYHPGPPAP